MNDAIDVTPQNPGRLPLQPLATVHKGYEILLQNTEKSFPGKAAFPVPP